MQPLKFGLPICSSVVTGRFRSPAEVAALEVRPTGNHRPSRPPRDRSRGSAGADRPGDDRGRIARTPSRGTAGSTRPSVVPGSVSAGMTGVVQPGCVPVAVGLGAVMLLRRGAKRVEDRHHARRRCPPARAASASIRSRVETGDDGDGRRLTPQAVDLDDERAAILRLHGVLAVARDLVVRRHTRILRREERNGVLDEDVAGVALRGCRRPCSGASWPAAPTRMLLPPRERRRHVVAERRRNAGDERRRRRGVAESQTEQRARLADRAARLIVTLAASVPLRHARSPCRTMRRRR